MQSIAYLRGSAGAANASVATVQNVRAPLATTILVNTVSGISPKFYGSMGTPHTFTDPVTGETITVISEASAVDFAGSVSGGSLNIDAIAPGYTDAGSKVGDIVVIRPVTEWANNLANILGASHNDDGTIKAPQGQLFNGQIVPSVASSNLTLAIKTLAGADPTAADPVYVRIGTTIRSITAALSVTLAAGTNWFSKGSAPLATVATNLYAYLGYNATDGVVLGVSSRAESIRYSDFSTTTTDFTYAKISNVAHAAATDVYENIGYFNAILGVSATFLWTLPAAASQIIITQPGKSIPQSPCRFSVYRNAAKSISAAAFTNILPDTKNFDHGNNVDIVTNVGRFTAPVAGVYRFSGSLYNNTGFGAGANHVMISMIYKNGQPALTGSAAPMWIQPTTSSVSGELLLAAGDYVELYGYCDVGPCTLTVGQTYGNMLSGFLVNPI